MHVAPYVARCKSENDQMCCLYFVYFCVFSIFGLMLCIPTCVLRVFPAFLSSAGESTFHLVRVFVWLWVFLLCYFQYCHVFSCFFPYILFQCHCSCFMCFCVFWFYFGGFTSLFPSPLCFMCFCVFPPFWRNLSLKGGLGWGYKWFFSSPNPLTVSSK